MALARQKHGEDHAEFAIAISWLAPVYQAQGRYAEAEPLYQRALTIAEKTLASDNLVEVQVTEKQDHVTEIFDKYNLLTLPVVDEDGKLAGVITADDVITVLRQR